jgi:hypothetical protein
LLERGEDARAADVSVLVQDGASFVERVRGESLLDGEDDIAPAGVSNDAVRWGGFFMKEMKNGLGGEFGDLAGELVFQASLGIHETDFFAVLVLVEGLKSMESKLVADGFLPPESCGGTVSEKAQADEDAWVVVQIKSRRGNLDGDGGDSGIGIRGKNAACCF